MLLVPYLTGAAALGFSWETLPGALAIICLYLSRPPLILLLKRRTIDGRFGEDAGALLRGAIVFALPGLAIFAWLVAGRGYHGLAVLGLGALALLAAHTWLSLSRRERSAPAEFTGVAMLTLTAPAGACLATGSLGGDALGLWALNALYFGVSVYYVKMRRRASAGRRQGYDLGEKMRLAGSLFLYLAMMLAVLALLMVFDLVPRSSAAAFVPVLIYVAWKVAALRPSLSIKIEGWTQLVLSLVFAAMIILGYR